MARVLLVVVTLAVAGCGALGQAGRFCLDQDARIVQGDRPTELVQKVCAGVER